MRVGSLAAAAAFALWLSGCAGRPEGVLAPVAETAVDATPVNMIVVTTRAATDAPGIMFTGDRGLTPSFAEITVSIPPESVRKPGEVE
jgi:esterase/lipase superfamily enzyme